MKKTSWGWAEHNAENAVILGRYPSISPLGCDHANGRFHKKGIVHLRPRGYSMGCRFGKEELLCSSD